MGIALLLRHLQRVLFEFWLRCEAGISSVASVSQNKLGANLRMEFSFCYFRDSHLCHSAPKWPNMNNKECQENFLSRSLFELFPLVLSFRLFLSLSAIGTSEDVPVGHSPKPGSLSLMVPPRRTWMCQRFRPTKVHRKICSESESLDLNEPSLGTTASTSISLNWTYLHSTPPSKSNTTEYTANAQRCRTRITPAQVAQSTHVNV